MSNTGVINISMRDTAIGRLEINLGKIKEETMLISVCLVAKKITKYYVDVAPNDNSTSEITNAKFDQLKKVIKREERVVITFVLNPLI